MKMNRRLSVLLLIVLLCCEFSEELAQGPPDDKKKGDDSNDASRESKTESQKELIATVQNRDGNTEIRIEPVPDRTKDKDTAKGNFFINTCMSVI